jgi:hypothetical protein
VCPMWASPPPDTDLTHTSHCIPRWPRWWGPCRSQ